VARAPDRVDYWSRLDGFLIAEATRQPPDRAPRPGDDAAYRKSIVTLCSSVFTGGRLEAGDHLVLRNRDQLETRSSRARPTDTPTVTDCPPLGTQALIHVITSD
jgi:hypothetical protein